MRCGPPTQSGSRVQAGVWDPDGNPDLVGGPFREVTAGDAVSRTSSATAPGRPAPPPPPTVQIAARIAQGADESLTRINMRLHPAELGRVDIKLDVGFDGRALAVITAERPDTLEVLQRDARLLERALAEAGLDTGSGGLSFGLAREDDNGFTGEGGGERRTGDIETDEDLPAEARPAADRLLDIAV